MFRRYSSSHKSCSSNRSCNASSKALPTPRRGVEHDIDQDDGVRSNRWRRDAGEKVLRWAGTKSPLSPCQHIGSRGPGRSCGEPIAMRLIPLDRTMELPLTLAGGLRATFADVVSSPLPEWLATLVRRLHADDNERSGKERDDGARATKTSSRIDRRGRR